jgi:hypothetical protein
MDPLSLAAGVAGLISLTLELNKIVSEYVGSVKRASTESRELAEELSALAHVLERLDRFLSNKSERLDSFDNTSVLYSTTSTCFGSLSRLKSILQQFMKSSEARRWYRSLVWPLKKEEHLQTIGVLHRSMQIFEFSLTIDGW